MKISALGIQIYGTLSSLSVSMRGLMQSDSDAIGIDTEDLFFAGLESSGGFLAKAIWETRTVDAGNLYLSGAMHIEPLLTGKLPVSISIACNSKVGACTGCFSVAAWVRNTAPHDGASTSACACGGPAPACLLLAQVMKCHAASQTVIAWDEDAFAFIGTLDAVPSITIFDML